MKKLIIIAIALIAVQAIAQRPQKMNNLSAEEMATLKTKRMTLILDLNESQQKEVQKINLENATFRKTMMGTRNARRQSGNAQGLTQDERLKMQNTRLDRQIAMKAKMKNILDEAQYTKWEKLQSERASRRKDNTRGRGMNRRN